METFIKANVSVQKAGKAKSVMFPALSVLIQSAQEMATA